MRFEILTVEDCPHVHAAERAVREAARLEAIDAEIHILSVDDPHTAVRLRFVGSPSVRIDGWDVEPDAHANLDYGIQCRMYREGNAPSRAPSVATIRAAIRRAR